jgi:hypothetical protein
MEGEGSHFPEEIRMKGGTDHIVGNVDGCDVIIVDGTLFMSTLINTSKHICYVSSEAI